MKWPVGIAPIDVLWAEPLGEPLRRHRSGSFSIGLASVTDLSASATLHDEEF